MPRLTGHLCQITVDLPPLCTMSTPDGLMDGRMSDLYDIFILFMKIQSESWVIMGSIVVILNQKGNCLVGHFLYLCGFLAFWSLFMSKNLFFHQETLS